MLALVRHSTSKTFSWSESRTVLFLLLLLAGRDTYTATTWLISCCCPPEEFLALLFTTPGIVTPALAWVHWVVVIVCNNR